MTGSGDYGFYQRQQRWAFLVGVNRYDDANFKPLQFCVNDVKRLEEMLTRLGYRVTCLYDGHPEGKRPTIEAVEDALTVFCQTVGRDDLAFVHFACHGDTYEKPGADGKREKQPVLVMQNTYKNSYARRSLHVADLEAQLRSIGAKDVFLSLDACHVGVEIGRDASDPEFIQYLCQDSKGFTMLAGSTAQQQAQEWGAVQHGIYTYYLLKGLSGEAGHAKDKQVVTASSLQNYVFVELKAWRLQHGFLPQEPTRKTEGTGDPMLACWQGVEPIEVSVGNQVSSQSDRIGTRNQTNESISSTRRKFYEQQLDEKRKDLARVQRDLAGDNTQEEERRLNNRAEQLLDDIEELEQKLI
ncbi:MAG: caspase family protein [Synechococcales bacterium]|nr:caspase family protein [Synechococcales bacterium]